MVYDEQRERIVLHGGLSQSIQTLNDTWEWDGESWRLVSIDGPRVSFHGAAFDAHRGVTVLYGGTPAHLAQYINETWEWDGESWTKLETGPNDPRLVLFSMVYDRQREKVIRHGGVVSGSYTHEDPATYEWNGASWTSIAQGSHIRGGQFAIYDSKRLTTTAFGGTSTKGFRPTISDSETWAFDGEEWNLVSAEGPSPRVMHAMAYDSHRGVGILFGGSPDGLFSPALSDTWEWNGMVWSKVEIESALGPRFLHSMAYDTRRRRAVLFGGSPHRGSASQRFFNETWEYGLIPLQLSGVMPGAEGNIEIQWTGELPPYQLQSRASLAAGEWQNKSEPTDATRAVVQAQGTAFFRVVSLFEGSP